MNTSRFTNTCCRLVWPLAAAIFLSMFVGCTSKRQPAPHSQIKDPAMLRAIHWLERAQDVNPGPGGVSYYYRLGLFGGWNRNDYKEVTGYIIETFLNLAETYKDEELKRRALKMADWEVTVQDSEGSWHRIVFDTGQVMIGLARAWEVTKNPAYRKSLVAAGDWLINEQNDDGSWTKHSLQNIKHSYHSRVAWGLLRTWQITSDERYRQSAIRNLDWVVSRQLKNGWIHDTGIGLDEEEVPLTHAIAYTASGLLESGLILGNERYIDAACKTADALLKVQKEDGSLTGGRYRSDWSVYDSAQCLTGDAQTSIVWLELYHHTGDAKYLDAAIRMNRYLRQKQAMSDNPDIDGGIFGSEPITGSYCPNQLLPWAAKFFIDALYLEQLYAEKSSALN